MTDLQAEIDREADRITIYFTTRLQQGIEKFSDLASAEFIRGLAEHQVRNRAVAQQEAVRVLVELVRNIEWSGTPAFEMCPWCYARSERGHKSGCGLETALAPFKVTKGDKR